MPIIRKLDPEEVRTIERRALGTRKATELEYDRYLAEFMPGDYGEVTLEGSEKRLTIRNRIKAAAGRRNPPLNLTFLRTRGNILRFRIEKDAPTPNGVSEPASSAPAASSAASEAAPAPKRRGRSKKAADASSNGEAPAARSGRRGAKATS